MSASDVAPVSGEIPVTGDLLRLAPFDPRTRRRAIPLLMEFQVNLDTGPFLVSSSRSVMWVNPRVPKVRAAFRPLEIGPFFQEVIDAVAARGSEAQWGNVHPLTSDGLLQAIGHLRSYDLPDIEILVHPTTDWSRFPQPVDSETDAGEVVRTVLGFPLSNADWLTPGTVVVVPQDRDFVGFVLTFGGRGLAVVHNASRGIAICRDAG